MYIPNWFTKSIGFEKPGGGLLWVWVCAAADEILEKEGI